MVAAVQIAVPAVKMRSAEISTGLRPKMWEKDAKVGWNTVEVRRKEVPAQKACIAVPLSSFAIVCTYISRAIATRKADIPVMLQKV